MGAFSNLLESLRPKPDITAPMDDPFIQIDIKKIASALKLEQRGRENGALNLPPSDSQTLDVVETEIVSEIGQLAATAHVDATNQIRTYEQRLAQLDLSGNLSSISGASRTAVGEFKTKALELQNRITQFREDVGRSYRELSEFRKEHKLFRPAHDAPPLVLTVGGILLSLIVETLLNSALLRVNDDFGWVGGIVAAALVSITNVLVLGAIAGKAAWRLLNKQSVMGRALGLALSSLWLMALIAWNLVAAHYRDLKVTGIDRPEYEAIRYTLNAPVHFESIYSIVLFAVGIGLGVLGAISFYHMDDPYPGYGAVSRRHRTRLEDYTAEVTSSIDELRSIRDDAIDDAEQAKLAINRDYRAYTSIVSHRNSFAHRYRQYAEQLDQAANTLLQQYRVANLKARTSPAPSHFSMQQSVASHLLSDQLSPFDRASMDERIAAANDDVKRAVEEINSAFESAAAGFQSLDNLEKGAELG